MNYNIGMDIGSTTVKIVVLDDYGKVVFQKYERHYSDIQKAVADLFSDVRELLEDSNMKIMITGSAGIGVAERLNAEFVQEVVASTRAVEILIPETDVAIELGGEDAKITYFETSLEQRMNGTCAGGTGAFIDQMASLLKTDAMGLNELAKKSTTIYSIASRCGVFAKTDIQPLLNDGAKKEDLAASIFQAVVNQTISGLACGKPIRGRVAFLGGPLHFLSELRYRFIDTLELSDDEIIFPEHAQYFVALGAANIAREEGSNLESKLFYDKLPNLFKKTNREAKNLEALFKNDEEYNEFSHRHRKAKIKRGSLENYEGKAFLGIDAGSTTTKLALINEDNELLYDYYGSNEGNPLKTIVSALKDLYRKIDSKTQIVASAVTGYGEHLIKAALKVDFGEVETVSHYKAAKYFEPNVDFIIDIGGQDMKSLKIRSGIIDSIMLNEACSSGCGSFIETFAKSLKIDIEKFASMGVKAKSPVDLGSRCTVFMNSRVKQAQKEGANVNDISAGIAMSVIKNALYKVIRIRDPKELGKHIVVQGGTFYNDAVLRSFEKITRREVVRPDIAGLMGAFGAAIIAKERAKLSKSSLLDSRQLESFTVNTEMKRCGLCGNNCLLTINNFSDGSNYITGNRCERGLGIEKIKSKEIPNLYKYKNDRLFNYYKPLSKDAARRGEIGMPRVLNMYEDYPFWFSFFTELGFRVILSSRSSKKIYENGMESIPSESVCYPAKLAHGHLENLIERGINTIWYPCIPYNHIEDSNAGNHYNCPIVSSYPETLKANMENLDESIKFYKDFLPIFDKKILKKRLMDVLSEYNIGSKEMDAALESAYDEYDRYKQDIKHEGEKALEFIKNNKMKGIVLAGRPYHVDPEINHGISELITSFDVAVLSEDSIAHLGSIERPIRVVDQWTYHTRLYSAAEYVSRQKEIELIQLNSFGCGLDAVTIDQVQDLLEKYDKIYTVVKIDEISNLGAVKIRLRSLLAAMNERDEKGFEPKKIYENTERKLFTADMKQRHTILVPQMSPIHFQFLKPGFDIGGYKVEILPAVDKEAIETGLKYVNNDACYPSIIVAGQMMQALQSGKYDLENTSLVISQTGGGCRATNYIAFIRKALKDAGLEHIPVISINAIGLEPNPGFNLTYKMIRNMLMGTLYGDLLMRLLYKVRPYEKVKDSTNELYQYWVDKCLDHLERGGKWSEYVKNVYDMVADFDKLEVTEFESKPKVGVVGEILVKYHPTANNDIVDVLESEGAEVVVPDLIDFVLYTAYSSHVNYELLGGSFKGMMTAELLIRFIERYRKPLRSALKNSKRFEMPHYIKYMAQKATKYLSTGNKMGEGWFLTAEMIELIESGVENIACIQPFACLPNHVTGKGMIKCLKKAYPNSNIAPIDYDPGASEVNQLNRLKLMMSTAHKMNKRNQIAMGAQNEEVLGKNVAEDGKQRARFNY
ncbi:MAG: 2-hydroxyacyl-CoA dehydratase [Tissierellales bacterium]|jgi:predicted CoA-substrate-specific enzyme activase|nr:2-hydroxyacyl-CoA dehydratase [Tissierellales bacterium]